MGRLIRLDMPLTKPATIPAISDQTSTPNSTITMKSAFTRIGACLLALSLISAARTQVVGFWQFNEKAPGNPCDTTVGAILDSSGNGHNGTASSVIPYVAGNPAYGSSTALEFGTNAAVDKIVVPDGSAGAFNFSSGQSVTVEAVIRANSAGQPGFSGNIISKQGAVASAPLPGEWYLRLINAAGNLRFTCSDGTSKTATGKKSLIDGKWHHVAGVYDASAQQLRVYVDYVLDTSVSTAYTGTIGNTNDLCLGQQNNNGAKFDGDIDFVRFSLGALASSNFVQASTSIANLSPANGSMFNAVTNVASFSVGSAVGVAASNIVVTVNGSNITSQLTMTGTDGGRTVTLPALAANILYNVTISVKDYNGFQATQSWTFDTFATNNFSFEGEDYNFGGGQYIDNPVLSSGDAPNNYLDQIGVQGVDFNQINTPVYTQYRIGDLAGTKVCPDTLRPAYAAARLTDPGVTDYMLEENADSEWVNYTRTFPAGTYHVYARLANPGTIPSVMRLDQVTAGSTTSSQTIAPIGTFQRPPTSGTTDFQYVPLTDALGNPAVVSLSGVNTLRVTFVSAGVNVLLNYLIFVPVTSPQVPFVAAVSPAAGAGNVAPNIPIQITLRNADTSVNTGTVQLLLDGSVVSATVTSSTVGANVSYTPSGLAVGWHTATLVFTDSAATSVTNQWQFFTASQPVLGYWKFNEQAPGNSVSINAGAIIDASGNAHNGTATATTLQYVAGSFNYGNSSALRFNGASGYVQVPDASGVFIFTNSFTMEAVIRSTNAASAQGAILAKNGLTDGEGEYWWRFPGTAGGQQEVGMNGLFVIGTNALNDGQWHHVAVVYNSTNNQVLLYADYVLDGSATSSFTGPIGRPTDLFLGSFINGGSFLNGDVDLIRISSGALSTNQFVAKTVGLQPILKSTLPLNGAVNVSPSAKLEAVFQNRDTSVAVSTLKLFVDGNNVTASAVVSTNGTTTTQIDYTAAGLSGGAHTATVIFQDTAIPANSWTNSWSFNVLASVTVLADWQFNEGAPGDPVSTNIGAILDSTGNGFNGTLNTDGLFYILGDADYNNGTSALNFQATPTNNVTVPDPAAQFNWLPGQSITMEAIVSTSSSGPSSTGGDLLAKQGASPGEWYWRITQTGTLRFSANDGTGLKSAAGTRNLSDGQWHHVAAVYDGTLKQMRVYSDYVQDGAPVPTTFTAIIGNTNESLFIGAQQNGGAHFYGAIDEVRVTAAALDPSWFIQPGITVTPPSSVSLTNAVFSSGSVSFSFSAGNNHSYVVKSTGDLSGTWTNVATIPGDGTVKTVSYPAVNARQFFRIVAQ